MTGLERLLRRDHREPGACGDVEIAPMRRRDLKNGVLEVEESCHQLPWSQKVFASEVDQMRHGSRHYVTARVDQRFVGHAGLWFAPDEAHVTNVAVAPSHRRRGVARRLLITLADVAIERGHDAWTLEVRASSTGALELYRRFGFVPAGIRQKYYANVEDAIVMWCHDIRTPQYRALLDALRTDTGDTT